MDGVGHAVVLAGLPDDWIPVVLPRVVDGHSHAQGEGGLALLDVAVADAVGAVDGHAELGVEPVEGLLGVALAGAMGVVESMTVELTVTATRSVDGKAGFKVPIVEVELGGGGSRERGAEQKVTVVFGGPVDREGNPVTVARATSELKG